MLALERRIQVQISFNRPGYSYTC